MKADNIAISLSITVFAAGASGQTLVRSVNGPAANAQYGKACIVVSDQNADGYDDVLVGAPGFNSDRGAIYCLSGAFLATGTGTQTLWTCAPTANQGDLFGSALADVGDVTGDGVHDFLVGQPGYDLSAVNDRGAVRLVSGSSHAALSLIYGTGPSAVLGTAVAACGDLSGDGKSEALVGSPGASNFNPKLYLLTGASLLSSGDISSVAVASLGVNGANDEEMGAAIAAGFDYVTPQPGVADTRFVAGSPSFDSAAGVDVGRVTYGRASYTLGQFNLTIANQYESTTAGERLGASVDAAHDYDGDGRVDVVVGAPDAPNGTPTENGRVVVLSGTALLLHTPPYEMYSFPFFVTPTQHGQNYHFGAAVRACADLNNDGVGEILAGAPDYFTAFSAGRGGVAIYSGATGTRFAFVQGATNDRLGGAIAGAVNDLDGDGLREFVVAGALSDAGGTDSGVVKCYRLFPMAPATYCTGKVNSLGCTPAVGFSGTPSSAAVAPFLVTCSNVISDRSGIFFYSHRPTSAAFQGGFLCVLAPVIRTAIQNSGGTPGGGDCLGTYSFDFNDWIVNGFDSSLSTGAEIYGQHWARDPQSASTTSLSNALRFVINP